MKEHEQKLDTMVVGCGVVLVGKDTPEGVLAMGQSYNQLAVCLLSLDP